MKYIYMPIYTLYACHIGAHTISMAFVVYDHKGLIVHISVSALLDDRRFFDKIIGQSVSLLEAYEEL